MRRLVLVFALLVFLIAVAVVLLTAPKSSAAPASADRASADQASADQASVSVPDTTVALTTLLEIGDHDMEDLDYADAWEGAFNGCSLLCAFGWQTEASSTLAPQGRNRYDVSQAEDGDPDTAWVEGVDGSGIGERLTFVLGAGEDLPDDFVTSFWGVRLFNGYGKSERAWEANGRVRYLDVLVNGEPFIVIEVHDLMMVQEATWEGMDVRPGDRIELVIADVYPGARYEDTALTEVLLMGAH
ncbi:MAG: hypothetical protein AAGG50_06975 [Bacteroidota bacterium]